MNHLPNTTFPPTWKYARYDSLWRYPFAMMLLRILGRWPLFVMVSLTVFRFEGHADDFAN